MIISTSRRLLTRHFNEIIDHGDEFEKQSKFSEKLSQEFAFLNQLPPRLKKFYPEVHSFTSNSSEARYFIKKIQTLDASYLLIDPMLYDEKILIDLLKALQAYLQTVPVKKISASQMEESFKRDIILKNQERLRHLQQLPEFRELDEICVQAGFSDCSAYLGQLNECLKTEILKENPKELYFSHGDLCFSNILFDGQKLFLIDPRGATSPDLNFRLIHYDLAKLSQSLLGRYDLINHELFRFHDGQIVPIIEFPNSAQANKLFGKMLAHFGTSLKTIRVLESTFFFSLIPYHCDSVSKMKAFLQTSIQIFKENS